MLALPVTMIVALVMGFLFVRTLLAGGYPRLFSALIFFCGAQGVVSALTQYYGVAALQPLQPVTATIIPPLAWVAFQTSAVRSPDLRRDLLHLAAPAFTAFCVAFAPVAVDAVVPGAFAAYGPAILVTLQGSSGNLPLLRLETDRIPALIWSVIALALIFSAVSDALISIALALDMGLLRPWIVSVFSSIALLSVGLLTISTDLIGEPEPVTEEPARDSAIDHVADQALIDRLGRLISEQRLYLDPDLTLARLARRLHVPIKQLSAAINRRTGENVSRNSSTTTGLRTRAIASRPATA